MFIRVPSSAIVCSNLQSSEQPLTRSIMIAHDVHSLFAGNPFLRAEVVVEKLGSWENISLADGSELGHHLRG